ncbi:lipid II:glycine glycyltransferase FemX [Treponema pectinovorum]|uniref:lipid II:glycine glycyltransferase FemX n=1 Tax=Treponema pectinovorum TaxID=164 RepID=UPI0011CC735B|nr:peptidoglycan bridge formation glycyltransferase FemA/FemB family protein [Treponema pectinovorum]
MIKIVPALPQDLPPTDIIFQTPFWGEFKHKVNKEKSLYFWVGYTKDFCESEPSFGSMKIFSLLVQIRKTKSNTVYAYMPRSPAINIAENERGFILEEIAFCIKDFLPKETLFIRFDIPWAVPGAFNSDKRIELSQLAMNFGTKHHNLYKAQSNHLCPNTVIMDLRPSPEKLLSMMRQQTRNSIRRSYKEGVEFEIYDKSSPLIMQKLEKWHKIYKQTAERKGFYYEEFEYFKILFEMLCQNNVKNEPRFDDKNIVPLDATAPIPEFYLFTASKENKILSGLILAICGSSAYYMYAASSLENRQCMPNYGLQWEVIRFARSKGCTKYDLMGIPPSDDKTNSMAGLFIFKTGFGGQKVHFGGTWDFPYDKEEYHAFSSAESLQLRP